MSNLDATEFLARRGRCSETLNRVLDLLMLAAENAGSEVVSPTFEKDGIGITYWTHGRRFCRFDPKHQADHVWAFVPGGAREALAVAGALSDQEPGTWVAIADMRGAVRLVAEIVKAYDVAAQT